MQLTPLQALLQFSHVLQQHLFPHLEAAVGPLSPPLQLLASVISLLPLEGLPHESKFSRAFAEFAATELPQQLHQAIIEATQGQRLIGHIARDSTAIPARERYSATARANKRAAKKKKRTAIKSKRKHPQGPFSRAKASERGTRIQRQRHQKLDTMLADLPQQCGTGAKKNSQGHEQYWRGYKAAPGHCRRADTY